jgi:uracil-DNA glycosylase family 4
MQSPSDAIALVRERVIACSRCQRLREYCVRVGELKKARFREETYWARPVPGFGDPNARVLVVGLAPAAHGANRTGRVFTGDGTLGSGDFLMRAMHAHGFASQPTSERKNDGLILRDAYITMAARCAPPDNKPTPAEIASCHEHLASEFAALSSVNVIVCLGKIAYDVAWRLLRSCGARVSPRPMFEHGAVHRASGRWTVIASYHPSRQNTNTGRLTPAMLSEVFRDARRIASLASAPGDASQD